MTAAAPATAAAKKHHKHKKPAQPHVVGAVYTETNGSPNQLLVFARYSNGTLKQRHSVATGGKGGYQGQPINVMAPPPVCDNVGNGCPALDTQAAIRATPDGKFVFAVNAGSNTVSSFRVTSSGPVLVSQVSSGGMFPDSLTVHGSWVYVLNSNSLNIQGYSFDSSGALTPIAGSNRALNPTGTAPGSPREVAFDNTGTKLVVTKLINPMDKGPVDTIDTFAVNSAGAAGAAVSSNSTNVVPFAVAFDSGDNALIAEVGDPFAFKVGSLASYSFNSSGGLTGIASASTNGYAPCWVVVSPNGRYAYVVNADILGPNAPSVSTFLLDGKGHATLKGVTPSLGDEPLETDDVLSHDGKYLYVLAPIADRAFGNISHIDVYKIGSNGRPTLIQQTSDTLAKGISGTAAF